MHQKNNVGSRRDEYGWKTSPNFYIRWKHFLVNTAEFKKYNLSFIPPEFCPAGAIAWYTLLTDVNIVVQSYDSCLQSTQKNKAFAADNGVFVLAGIYIVNVYCIQYQYALLRTCFFMSIHARHVYGVCKLSHIIVSEQTKNKICFPTSKYIFKDYNIRIENARF